MASPFPAVPAISQHPVGHPGPSASYDPFRNREHMKEVPLFWNSEQDDGFVKPSTRQFPQHPVKCHTTFVSFAQRRRIFSDHSPSFSVGPRVGDKFSPREIRNTVDQSLLRTLWTPMETPMRQVSTPLPLREALTPSAARVQAWIASVSTQISLASSSVPTSTLTSSTSRPAAVGRRWCPYRPSIVQGYGPP